MDELDNLVHRAKSGDSALIEALVDRHLPGLLAYVRLQSAGIASRKEESVDLVQSVCREVLEKFDGFEYRGEGAFRSWLFEIALTKIRDRARYWCAEKRDWAREQSQLEYTLYSLGDSPLEFAIREEDLQRLEQAFAELSAEHRQVVSLAYVVGLSRSEIAAATGRSEAAVRSLLHRALARLSSLLVRE